MPIDSNSLKRIGSNLPMLTDLRSLKLIGSRWLKRIDWHLPMQIGLSLLRQTDLHSLTLTD